MWLKGRLIVERHFFYLTLYRYCVSEGCVIFPSSLDIVQVQFGTVVSVVEREAGVS